MTLLPMKRVSLSELQAGVPNTCHWPSSERSPLRAMGKPAGLLIGNESESDWFDHRLEQDARFLERIERARRSSPAAEGFRPEGAGLGRLCALAYVKG
jgi:hypothetical protein